MKPAHRIIEICDANPLLCRKDVLALCEAEGINRSTASTIYAKWKREHSLYLEVQNVELPVDSITYADCQQESKSLNEKYDCAVKAVAIVTQTPYSKVHADLKTKGRKNRQGTYPAQYLRLLKDYGFEAHEFFMRPKTMLTAERLLKRHCAGHRVLVRVRDHVAAFDGTKIDDWSAGGKRRVIEMLLIAKAGEL